MANVRKSSGDSNAVVVRETEALKRLKRETEADARRLITKLIEVGRRLTLVRATIKHGSWVGVEPKGWMKYLKKNFDWSPDTAANYMRLYQFSKTDKFRTVRNFMPIGLLYRMARMGEEEQQQVIERVEGGEKPRQAMRDVTVGRRTTRHVIRSIAYASNSPPSDATPRSHNALPPPPPQPVARPVFDFSPQPPPAPAAASVTRFPSPVNVMANSLAKVLKEIAGCYADHDDAVVAAVAAIVSLEDIEIIERIVQAVKKAKAGLGRLSRQAIKHLEKGRNLLREAI
jgi:hypothetical protein